MRSNHGGIAGYNNGTIDGCTSAVTISQASIGGGVAAYNEGTVSNCRAVGVTFYEVSSYGAIVYLSSSILSHNYYYGCNLVLNGITYSNVFSEVTENDGTVQTRGIPLLDGASNESLIADYSSRVNEFGVVVTENYTLAGRTLYKDGSWNTICQPFTLPYTTVAQKLASPASIMTLASTTFINGTLTLNFEEVPSNGRLEAGKPYIVRWERANDYENDNLHNLVNPTFEMLEISTATNPTTTDYVDFIGTTSPVALAANDRTVLYLGADNTLYYPSANMTIGSFRGYFRLKGIEAGDPASGGDIKAFQLNFDGMDQIPTLVSFPSESEASGLWYDLSGRKLHSSPLDARSSTLPGVYIHNGKKVVIK